MNLNFTFFSRIRESWDYRSEPEKMQALGEMFWRALLVFALIAIVLSAGAGMQEMAAVAQAESVLETPSAVPPPLDPMILRSALGAFSSRQALYQATLQSPAPQTADPSK
jgi:hypothetical protein